MRSYKHMSSNSTSRAFHSIDIGMQMLSNTHILKFKDGGCPKLYTGYRQRQLFQTLNFFMYNSPHINRCVQKFGKNPRIHFIQRFSWTKLRETKWIWVNLSVFHTRLYAKNPWILEKIPLENPYGFGRKFLTPEWITLSQQKSVKLCKL